MKRIIRSAISVLTQAERSKLLGQIVLNTLVSVGDIGSLALLLALIHFYTAGTTAGGSHFADVLVNLQEVHFLLPLLLFLLLFMAKNALAYYTVKRQYGFIYDVASRISSGNMERYLGGSYADYAQINPSVHIARISYQPMEYATYILAGIQQLFTEGMLTGLAITAVLLFNAKLFLLLLIVLLPPVIGAAWISRRRLNAARAEVKESAENATQHLQEALAGFIESNAYGRKAFFTGRFSSSQRRLSATLSQLQITQAIPPRFIEVFAVFGLLALILLNRYTGSGSMELVNIGAFMAAAYKIIPGISRIANTGAQMRMYQHSIEAAAGAAGILEDDLSPEEPVREISFRDVSFRHNKKGRLLHFNLDLKKGDFVGISASSGKGKTTLVNLLLGFLEPDEGRILINGQSLDGPERKQYWPFIAYVKQQAFLIHDTIEANITLQDGRRDEQRLQEAIRMAGLGDFVGSFPEGAGKVISDGGKNISGGQRQRIALARAFYKDAPVLILDEPFSELDAVSEHAILERLAEMAAAGRIILFITHNKKSLQFCNKTLSFHE